ncbi:hypothetical protein Cgig2_034085 [Carnegiea gigantea]|uniref:DUF4283 domain-containing protein n=1 Tax=Carnegiea gigantea TaxID=171969 RepID=A0A9Q1K062_9CARY|nr:hypothetical protein Cgig2_034085 [Carnegiea gigantea]
MALFTFRGKMKQQGGRKQPQASKKILEEEDIAKKVRLSEEGPQESNILKGEVNSNFMDWLSRSLDRMEEVLSNHEELDLWFISVKKWEKFDYCETRRVWIEIFRVPPHRWTWDNFKKVTDIWGRIVCLGKSIARIDFFDSMKVLIDTDRFYIREADVIPSIEDSGYRLKIKEVGPSVQVIQPAHILCSSPLAEAMDSNHE